MGRPEKPPSSAYSLFSKEMLNTEFIKQFPSKERMSHISEAWKKVNETEKEAYQTKVCMQLISLSIILLMIEGYSIRLLICKE